MEEQKSVNDHYYDTLRALGGDFGIDKPEPPKELHELTDGMFPLQMHLELPGEPMKYLQVLDEEEVRKALGEGWQLPAGFTPEDFRLVAEAEAQSEGGQASAE